jgi:hypothetical protein
MKPKSFFDLPSRLQESLLWDIELNYEPYSQSKPELIHYLSVAGVDPTNRNIIDRAYASMTESHLKARAKSVLEDVSREENELNDFLKS